MKKNELITALASGDNTQNEEVFVLMPDGNMVPVKEIGFEPGETCWIEVQDTRMKQLAAALYQVTGCPVQVGSIDHPQILVNSDGKVYEWHETEGWVPQL